MLLPEGVVLAGVLLLLTAVPGAGCQWSHAPFFPFASWLAGTGDARNTAHLAVLAAGVVLPAVVIHLRWERGHDEAAEAAD